LRAARSVSSEPCAASHSRAICCQLFQPKGEYSAEIWNPIECGSAETAVARHSPYLADIFARIHDHKINRIDELLPWNWKPFPNQAAEA
jgi:hypothetical protein